MKSKEKQISVTINEQFKMHRIKQNKYADGKRLGSLNEVKNLLNEDK